jgi:transposase-like protein
MGIYMNEYAARPRRRYTPQEKREMVELALNADDSIAAVAQRLEINQNQLSRWIREYRRGDAWAAIANATWLPVVLEDANESGSNPGAAVSKADLPVSVPDPVSADVAQDAEAVIPASVPVACLRIGTNVSLELTSPSPALLKSLVEALR